MARVLNPLGDVTEHDRIVDMQPEHSLGDENVTTLEYSTRFVPGSRTVIFRYGRIPGYRSDRSSTGRPSYTSWGFSISDDSATDMWYGQYTCGLGGAKALFEQTLKPNAEARGFVVKLEIDQLSELAPDLTYTRKRKTRR